MKKIGLYIKIPYDLKNKEKGKQSFFYAKNYFELLKKEISLRKLDKYVLDSIYISVEIKSIDNSLLKDLINYIHSEYKIQDYCEKTIEIQLFCGKKIKEKIIKEYTKLGFNRVSIKTCEFDIEYIKKIVSIFIENGIENIDYEFQFGSTGQEIFELSNRLNQLCNLSIKHFSFYSVTEDDEFQSNMLSLINKKMEKEDFIHYEINHYSKKGYESYHNTKYWNLDEYLGIGVGTIGYIGGKQYTNDFNIKDYMKNIIDGKLAEYNKLTKEETIKDYIIGKMGMVEGIKIKDINKKFNIDFMKMYNDVINLNINRGILEKTKENIRFTKKGLYNSNKFFVEII